MTPDLTAWRALVSEAHNTERPYTKIQELATALRDACDEIERKTAQLNECAEWLEESRLSVRELTAEVMRLHKAGTQRAQRAAEQMRDRAKRLASMRSCSWSKEDDLRSLDYREGVEAAASQLAAAIGALPLPTPEGEK